LRAKFREYLMESTVNFNTKLKEAASFGQPITEYDPGSRGYKDFANLARELMGARPVEIEPIHTEKLSRPAELVQRAKQLSQLTNLQFGRGGGMPFTGGSMGGGSAPLSTPVSMAAPVSTLNGSTIGRAPLFTIAAPSAARTSAAVMAPSQPIPQVKSTAQKIEEFYGVKQFGEEVIFSARFEAAKRVLIAGDFNNWMPESTPMVKNTTPGKWTMSLPLRPGRYRYRFMVDGEWVTDPNNKYVEANQFGELNNIIEVM